MARVAQHHQLLALLTSVTYAAVAAGAAAAVTVSSSQVEEAEGAWPARVAGASSFGAGVELLVAACNDVVAAAVALVLEAEMTTETFASAFASVAGPCIADAVGVGKGNLGAASYWVDNQEERHQDVVAAVLDNQEVAAY